MYWDWPKSPQGLHAWVRALKNISILPFPFKVWPISLLTLCMEGGQFGDYSIIFRITVKRDPEIVPFLITLKKKPFTIIFYLVLIYIKSASKQRARPFISFRGKEASNHITEQRTATPSLRQCRSLSHRRTHSTLIPGTLSTKVNVTASSVTSGCPTIFRILVFLCCFLLYYHKLFSYERDIYSLNSSRKQQWVIWTLENTFTR